MSSSPCERSRTSFACQSKAMAADSGTALRCAITSFLASARAKLGARPLARMPAIPPLTRLRRRMEDRLRLLIFMIVDMARPPRRFIYDNPILAAGEREAPPSDGSGSLGGDGGVPSLRGIE